MSALPDMTTARASIPLAGRLTLFADPSLGMGNFLDKAHRVSPAATEPFLFAQRADAGGMRIEPLSLRRLIAIRDGYASWYHEAGIQRGEPVGICVSEDVEPFLHYLALSSLGAVAALVNARMPAVVAAAYLRRVGVVGVVATADRLRALEAAGALSEGLRVREDVETLRAAVNRVGALPAVFPYRHGDREPVMLCHTSGTTGLPKAATFGHSQFFLGKRQRLLRFPPARDNRMLSALRSRTRRASAT